MQVGIVSGVGVFTLGVTDIMYSHASTVMAIITRNSSIVANADAQFIVGISI